MPTLRRDRSPPDGATHFDDWGRMKIPDFSGAVCKTVGTEFFYPDEEGEYHYLLQVRKICDGCPVKTECLEWGLKHESQGIWGGKTPIQRKQLRRTLGITLQTIDPRADAVFI